MRTSFVFYRSFYESITNCPDDAQLLLFRAVSQYALDQVEPTFAGSQYHPFLDAIWAGIKPQIDANTQRYLNGCKGGAPVGNQNARKQPKNNLKQPNENENENENENANGRKSKGLELPFQNKAFIDTWNELRRQPRWHNKSNDALRKTLTQLSKYDAQFAIHLMDIAIANGYQGVVFADTDKTYEQWKLQAQRSPTEARKVITRIEELYNDKAGRNQGDGTI